MVITATESPVSSGPPALQNLRLRAEIDWVDVRITLPRPSQFRHVKNRLEPTLGNVFVSPDDSCTEGRRYTVRLHDPRSPSQVLQMLQPAVAPGGSALTEDNVEICAIEVAIDVYHPQNDLDALALAAQHFFVHHAFPPQGPPRLTAPQRFHVPFKRHEVLEHLKAKNTIHGGPKDTTFSSHFYVKTTDTVDGQQYAILSPERHCARFELTWRGGETPFGSLAQWREFKFQSLSTQFAMVRPTAIKAFDALIQNSKVQLGSARGAPRRRPSDRRKSAPNTSRDIETNEKIRQALKALTLRQCC